MISLTAGKNAGEKRDAGENAEEKRLRKAQIKQQKQVWCACFLLVLVCRFFSILVCAWAVQFYFDENGQTKPAEKMRYSTRRDFNTSVIVCIVARGKGNVTLSTCDFILLLLCWSLQLKQVLSFAHTKCTFQVHVLEMSDHSVLLRWYISYISRSSYTPISSSTNIMEHSRWTMP